MKWHVSAAAIVAAASLAAVGCGSQDNGRSTTGASGESGAATSSADGATIGVSSLSQSLPFVAAIVKGMQAEAKAQGAKVILTDAQAKSDKQTADIQDLLSQNPDGVVMIPVDSKVAQGQVNSIAARDLPVVSAGVAVGDPLQRPLKDVYPKLTALVTQDEPKVGEQAAALVEEVLPEGGDVAIISGQPGFAENTTRVTRFKPALEKAGKYRIVADQPGNWVPADAQAACANLLASNPDIKLFYTLSDDMAVGCDKALKAANSDAKIVSIGGYKVAIDAIKSGRSRIAATVCFQPQEMGKIAMQTALANVAGTSDDSAVFKSYPTFGVTADTVDKCVPQA
jgi:ABC-type sugar transport system substrate-binding protein